MAGLHKDIKKNTNSLHFHLCQIGDLFVVDSVKRRHTPQKRRKFKRGFQHFVFKRSKIKCEKFKSDARTRAPEHQETGHQ